MPQLSISDGGGGLLFFAPTFLLASMLYPRDEAGRVQYLAWRILATAAETPEPEGDAVPQCVVVPQFALQAAVAAPSYNEVIKTAISQAEGAHAAGEVLRFIVKCRIHHPEHPPSVSKTWDVLSKTLAGELTRDGRPRSSSISFLKEAWATFKPVAHLWAAAHALPDPTIAPPLEFDPARLEGLPAFLALAEAFRKLGESIIAQGQTIPVLNPAETWCNPPDLILLQIEIDLPPLSEATLRLLAARRAPRRTP
jgi:hypothetical protein